MKLNAKHWMEQDKHPNLVLVRDSEIEVGERYEYRSPTTITHNATYYADVKQITPHNVIVDLTIDQSSAPIERYGIARTYNWSIRRCDLGRTERLYRRTR